MKKKALTQSLRNSVTKLDKINNLEINFTGTLEDVMKNPIEWAEQQVQRGVFENLNKYLEAKELGEEFWGEVKDNN
jgi:hypothetical protein